MSHSLRISEEFVSIQGEGPSKGCPSIFLRLQGCNLTCGGMNTLETKDLDSGATWRCDTMETWRYGDKWEIGTLLAEWKKKGYIKHLENGYHLVITGGEPLLQMEALSEFLQKLPEAHAEIETNGCYRPSPALEKQIHQFNVSPKLSNSGMPKEKRLVPDVLSYFSSLDTAHFKVVISSKSDLDELIEDIVKPYNIPMKRLWLMPAASSRDELVEKSPKIIEWALEIGARYSSRLQLVVWDECCGV